MAVTALDHAPLIEVRLMNALATVPPETAQVFRERVLFKTPMGRLGQSVEIANMVPFLASDEANYVTDADMLVYGGLGKPSGRGPPPSPAEIMQYLIDRHCLTRPEMVPILGTASRVSKKLRGDTSARHEDGAALARPVPRVGRVAAANEVARPPCDQTC